MLIRALPSFDERALSFGTFSDFLGACPHIVKIVDRKSGGHIDHVGIEDKEQPKLSGGGSKCGAKKSNKQAKMGQIFATKIPM